MENGCLNKGVMTAGLPGTLRPRDEHLHKRAAIRVARRLQQSKLRLKDINAAQRTAAYMTINELASIDGFPTSSAKRVGCKGPLPSAS